MRTLVADLALILGCLGLIAVAVFRLGDTSVLVPPPEAAAESFMHQLATRRYSRALPYLEEGLARGLDASSLGRATEELEARIGRIRDVHGEPGLSLGQEAEATAALRTPQGKVAARVRLVRQHGLWRIQDVDGLHLAGGP